jgi:hypothetical protein
MPGYLAAENRIGVTTGTPLPSVAIAAGEKKTGKAIMTFLGGSGNVSRLSRISGVPMTIARAHLVDVATTRWYHCVTRCVRRAFLLAESPFDRKEWIDRRLEELQR